MTEAHFYRLIKTSNWPAFRAAAWELFHKTGEFVDVMSGQIYSAPDILKKRPGVAL
jgi:hypothetical protein